MCVYVYEYCGWSNENKVNILKRIGPRMTSHSVFKILLFHILVL